MKKSRILYDLIDMKVFFFFANKPYIQVRIDVILIHYRCFIVSEEIETKKLCLICSETIEKTVPKFV